MSNEPGSRPRRRHGDSVDCIYLAEAGSDGDFRELFVLAGRYGSRGGFRLTERGWVADDLPIEWLVGDATHLDPVTQWWARRRAHQVGVDDITFDRPTRRR